MDKKLEKEEGTDEDRRRDGRRMRRGDRGKEKKMNNKNGKDEKGTHADVRGQVNERRKIDEEKKEEE